MEVDDLSTVSSPKGPPARSESRNLTDGLNEAAGLLRLLKTLNHNIQASSVRAVCL